MSDFLFLHDMSEELKVLREDTNLCKILPNFFRLFVFSFPLLTNDLGNIGVVESRIASDYGLLVVLPIKDKCYKEVRSCGTRRTNKESILCSFPITRLFATETI
jgi:hypothetical protein